MRYRREASDEDYTFGQGDNTWLVDSPDAVAQAVKTRLALWSGQWFLDSAEGMPWNETVLGNAPNTLYDFTLRQHILETRGVHAITAMDSQMNAMTRRRVFTITLDTDFGATTLISEV